MVVEDVVGFPLEDLRRSGGEPRAIVTGLAILSVAAIAFVLWGHRPALLLLGGAAWSFFLIPRIAPWIRRWNVVAHPGGRSVHERPTPLLGGAALFVPLAAVLCWWAFGRSSLSHLGLFAAIATVVAVGLWDDVRPLSPGVKLAGEVLAGVWLAVSGFSIDTIHLPPLAPLDTGWMGGPLVVVAVVVASNAFNLIDGLDGLATGIALL